MNGSMIKNLKTPLIHGASYLFCAMLVWFYFAPLEGTEFSGGRLTGPLLNMSEVGFVLFLLAGLLTSVVPRVAGSLALAASLLSLPLYFYFTAPGLLRSVFRGEYSVPAKASFVSRMEPAVGIACLMLTALVSLRALTTRTHPARGSA